MSDRESAESPPDETATAGEPSPTSEARLRRARLWSRAVQLVAIVPLVGGGFVYLLVPEVRDALDRGVGLLARGELDALREWGRELGPWAALATTTLMIVQAIAAPIPAVLVTATNSWLFGWFAGAVLSIAAATLAALICYVIGGTLGEPVVRRLISDRGLDRAERFLTRHGAATVLGARLVPFVPFDPISYVAGMLRMHPWTFAWATFIGQLPAGFTYSYVAQHAGDWKLLVLIAGPAFGLLLVFGLVVRRWLFRDREVADGEILERKIGAPPE